MQGNVARCQCDPSCRRSAVENGPFCEQHMKYCPRKSPLTGFEPVYNPDRYNKTRQVKDSHNCFAYAFDHMDLPPAEKCNETGCNIPFHQPGRMSGYPKWSRVKGKRCPDLLARLRGDVHGITKSSFTRKCPKGTSKIALVVDPEQDYHFYRQDRDRYWSHKPGATDVTRVDAMGRIIYDPELAARDYRKKSGRLNYNVFCGYLCAPRRKTLRFKRGGRLSTTRRKRTS